MNLTLFVYFDVKHVEKNVFLSFSSIWNTWKFWPNRELVTPSTQSSALDLLGEDFHNTIMSRSHTHPSNPIHSTLVSITHNPTIQLLIYRPPSRNLFFKLSIAFRLLIFTCFIWWIFFFLWSSTYKDEIFRVQITPPIVTIKLLFILYKKKKMLVEDKVANFYISWNIFSIRAKHWQIFLGM